MLNTINSIKLQKAISYYTEDIDLCESGEYACTGYADDGGGSYDITFELNGAAYLVKDITKIDE